LKLSVVIPTCDRPESLAACLARLAPGVQTLGFGLYEVIVTDDGRQIRAEQELGKTFPWVRWVVGPKRGPAANRNNGAKSALGPWLAFIDDDCLPEPIWLAAIAEDLASGLDLVEGKTACPDARDTPFQEHVENLNGGLLWSCNMGIRREAFEELGGFDEDFIQAGGEDMEFAWRAKRAKLAQLFEPKALVIHPARTVGLGRIVRRMLMIRWMSLYHIKTKQSPALTSHPMVVVLWLAWTRFVNLLRTSVQSLKGMFGQRGNRATFNLALDVAAFPFLLPYIVLWEFRFRTMLRERTDLPVDRPIPMPRAWRYLGDPPDR
jgi:GT2 family glycosyltransferase